MICTVFTISAVIFLFGVALKSYIKLTTARCKSKTCLVGKTAVVTGGNSGMGYETALDFATRGARVILCSPLKSLGDEAREKIVELTGNDNIVVGVLDLASFKSVRDFSKRINETEARLDILVNNAGVNGGGDEESEDGHPLLMQINYFSHFLLTNLLMGLLKKTNGSRVVNLGSMIARMARQFSLEKLDKVLPSHHAYIYSKLCLILFTKELARKLEGTKVTTYCLHPGSVKSGFLKNSNIAIRLMAYLFFKTCEEGAQTTIHCAVAKGIENFSGEHFDSCRRVDPYGTVIKNLHLTKKLWELSESVVQLKPEEIQI